MAEHKCIKPVLIKERIKDKGFCLFANYDAVEYIHEVKPFMIDFEPNSNCAGSCAYCYASSDVAESIIMPKEKIKEAIDDAWRLGIRCIQWCGGDAILHPDWYELSSYIGERGGMVSLLTSGLISKKVAREIVQLKDVIQMVGINLGSVNQEAYNKVHVDPTTMQKKMNGFRNLLEAGYPVDQVMHLITTTQPALDTMEETLDWSIDEMGCRSISFIHYKSCGFASQHRSWEPTLSSTKKAMEYRAKKLGQYWMKMGGSDGSFLYCRVNLAILYDGSVSPCTMLREPEHISGNIYNESLVDIFNRSKDWLLFNFEVKGECGNCKESDICFGCRATAYHYLGDVAAPDPKCPFNPEAKETYWR